MLVQCKKQFRLGIAMLVSFFIVLAYMFTPHFGEGHNAFEASDKLFNSISKGSTYYLPAVRDAVQKSGDKQVSLTLNMKSPEEAAQTGVLLAKQGDPIVEGTSVKVSVNLTDLLLRAVNDSDAMFANNEAPLATAYGMNGKLSMFTWWKTLHAVERDLKRQHLFSEAALVMNVVSRGVEVGYNYFGIEAESASSRAGILSFSLIFYVVYTLWFGFGIFFLFEGIGLQMKGGKKKEV